MGFLDKIQSLLRRGRLDVSSRFELLREAISGTMSNFYMAKDRNTGEIVGLKIGDREKMELFEARFKGLNKPPEGEIATHMSHPNIVKTFEYGKTTDGLNYVVMEFLPGFGMHVLVNKRDPELEGRRLLLIRQMAAAIGEVHRKGFIHRDVCPRNFICSPSKDFVTLIDFGLSVPATADYMQAGNRTGTPLYMAPEVVRRRKTDQRLDVFSLGVTAYQVCCYDLPWVNSDTTGKAALQHDTVEPVDIFQRRPDLNKTLGNAIKKCINPNADRRPQSVDDFLSMIRTVESDTE
ncbi:MAG: serine/threonine protein kinase [Pirellulaceae bacterium]|jgi:serine/threonine protein kinase